jgi:hypothetical protein
MCKSIFGVLKWSISPKKWYCCVSKHGDAMVLPPQNFHKLDVKFRFRPNSKCRISEYLWKIERKVPSWDNRTKMHRMHFVVFFFAAKRTCRMQFVFNCLKTTLTNHPVTARVQGKDSDHGHRMVVRYSGDLGREFPIDSVQPPREPLLVGGLEHFFHILRIVIPTD